eukprot:980177-Prorocentrum_minimum.AAC.3
MISRKVGRTCRISIFILTIVSCNSAQVCSSVTVDYHRLSQSKNPIVIAPTITGTGARVLSAR